VNPTITWTSVSISFPTDVQTTYSLVCASTCEVFGFLPAKLNGGNQFKIDTKDINLPSDIGTHLVTISCVSTNFPTTVVPASFTLNVIVQCAISSFTLTTTVTDFNYILNSGSIEKGPYTTTQTLNCKYPVTYTVNQAGVGDVSSLFSPTTMFYTFAFTNPALIGTVQTFTMTSSITTAAQGVLTATSVLNISIKPDCPNSYFLPFTVNNMSIVVGGTQTQSLTWFADQTATVFGSAGFCGARNYVFSPVLPSFLSFNTLTSLLTLSTVN
jgi:hypothetical protein